MAARDADSAQEVVSALAALGVVAQVIPAESNPAPSDVWVPDAQVRIGDAVVSIEAKGSLRSSSISDVLTQVKGREPVIVVADRIPAATRQRLRDAGVGFLDKSGHLRVVLHPNLVIDVDLPRSKEIRPRGSALDTGVGLDVAITTLAEPKRRWRIRELARWIGRDSTGVARIIARLRDEGLLDEVGLPVVPDLFYATASRWNHDPVPLERSPLVDAGSLDDQLRLNLHDLARPGWVLTDTLAASYWKVPLVARGDYPPDFYLPDVATYRRALNLLGPARSVGERGCSVAIAPAKVVCLRRVDLRDAGSTFPVVSHVVLALDLTLDPSRGAEALRAWRPKDVARVW